MWFFTSFLGVHELLLQVSYLFLEAAAMIQLSLFLLLECLHVAR